MAHTDTAIFAEGKQFEVRAEVGTNYGDALKIKIESAEPIEVGSTEFCFFLGAGDRHHVAAALREAASVLDPKPVSREQ